MKTPAHDSVGGYDDGYRLCACFWGRQPGSLVVRLLEQVEGIAGLSVLDAGCGEGKNAIHLARLGANVRAIDISPIAIQNARCAWPDAALVDWEVADIRSTPFQPETFDMVIAYGLLNCLDDPGQVCEAVRRLQVATLPGGYHAVCTFNSRFQDLRAHPGFEPVLVSHAQYLDLYCGWKLLYQSDQDLYESHPHNRLPHVHSMTRVLARKGAAE